MVLAEQDFWLGYMQNEVFAWLISLFLSGGRQRGARFLARIVSKPAGSAAQCTFLFWFLPISPILCRIGILNYDLCQSF
ncbi:hypothetical protein M8494_27610 [Serratia ureilytica]